MKTAFLGDAASRDAQQVGAKAATLSRLADRFRVPAGFCLDASVFDETPLVQRAKAGDTEAFSELVRKYERKIYRLAKNITQNDEDAEDVLREHPWS